MKNLFRFALGQFTSTENIKQNLKTCQTIIQKAASMGARAVFLPEASDYIGSLAPLKDEKSSEHLHFIESIQKEANTNNIWVYIGVHEPTWTPFKQSTEIEKAESFYNTLMIISPKRLEEIYRKVHLFDLNLPDCQLKESDEITPGDQIVTHQMSDIIFGLSICYDLRFPEFYVEMQKKKPVDIILVPSAFTAQTGKAHWELLCRTRAIENQCFLIASCQVGQHSKERKSWGQSLVVDPWGKVLVKMKSLEEWNGEDYDLVCEEINLSQIEEVRKRMPIQQHRLNAKYFKS